MKKKCLLIFPPLAHPAQPYLSVPLLAGQLKKEGFDVSSRDLNVEFFNDILDKKYIESCLLNRKKQKKIDTFCSTFSTNIKDAIDNVTPVLVDGYREYVTADDKGKTVMLPTEANFSKLPDDYALVGWSRVEGADRSEALTSIVSVWYDFQVSSISSNVLLDFNPSRT